MTLTTHAAAMALTLTLSSAAFAEVPQGDPQEPAPAVTEPQVALTASPATAEVMPTVDRKLELAQSRKTNISGNPMGLLGFGPIMASMEFRHDNKISYGPTINYWDDIFWTGIDVTSVGVRGTYAITGDVMGTGWIAAGGLDLGWTHLDGDRYGYYEDLDGFSATLYGGGGYQHFWNNGWNVRAVLGLSITKGFVTDFEEGYDYEGVHQDFKTEIAYAF